MRVADKAPYFTILEQLESIFESITEHTER